MDVDLKPMIERLVEREKEYIRDDREDYGCAMAVVVMPEKNYLDFPKFDDEDSKREAYERLINFAKEKNATAIVTLNNAWTRAAQYPGDLDDIGSLEIDATNGTPCLLVTISGPGMKSCAFEMEFELLAREVRFRNVGTT